MHTPTETNSIDSVKAHIQHREAKAVAVAKLRPCDVLQSDAELKADIELARRAFDLFLNSEMRAAEQLMLAKSHRLYLSLGAAILASFKALMVRTSQCLLKSSGI